jgi:hypothetical protein
VTKSSVLLIGVPQDEQKRPVLGSSVPHEMQEGMIFSKQFTRSQL